jgi:hypothetical protein
MADLDLVVSTLVFSFVVVLLVSMQVWSRIKRAVSKDQELV